MTRTFDVITYTSLSSIPIFPYLVKTYYLKWFTVRWRKWDRHTPSTTIYQMLISRGRWESCKEEMKWDEKGSLEEGSVWADAGNTEESSSEKQLKQRTRMWSLGLWEAGSGSTGLRDGCHGVWGTDNTRKGHRAVTEVCLLHDGATWETCRGFLFVFNYVP